MARIRTIKPEFWAHPVMSRQDDSTRMLAIALLNIADDEGFFHAEPALIRSAVWPFDEDSSKARRTLETLSKIGWIEVVEHPTHGMIGRVVNFEKHQRVDRPSPSKIKAYHDSSSIRRTLDERSPLEQGTGNREQGTGNSTTDVVLVGSVAADENPGDNGDRLPNCPHQRIIALYGEIIPEQPQPRSWDGQRAKNLTARWRWVLTAKKRNGQRYATTEEEGVDFFRRLFMHMRCSDFLIRQWTGWDLGWIVKAENFEKIIAGNYDNREAA